MKELGLPPLDVVERMQKDRQHKQQQDSERRKNKRYWRGMLAYDKINSDYYSATEDTTDAEVIK